MINLENDLRTRERDIQRQEEESRIRESKYNKKYKHWMVDEIPDYLRSCKKGDEVSLIARLRCGSLEEGNKYWLQREEKLCIFCHEGIDKLEHYVRDCEVAKGWFEELKGGIGEKVKRLGTDKRNEGVIKIIRKIYKEREKRLRKIERKD